MIVSQDGTRRITAEELDERFDNGEELDEFFDTEHPRRIEPDSDAIFTVTLTKKINLDLPLDMVEQIDASHRPASSEPSAHLDMGAPETGAGARFAPRCQSHDVSPVCRCA